MSEKGYTEVNGQLVKLPEAPPMLLPPARPPIKLTINGEHEIVLSWEDAAEVHKNLGQELAKGMRVRPDLA